MDRLNKDKAAKVGDVLFRYMRTRHPFKEKVEHPLPAHELAALIGGGKMEFDEIYIEPDASPPIIFDGKADDVFEAIIQKRYRAIPSFDPELVAAWRFYVISDGPMPRRPAPRQLPQGHPIEPALQPLCREDLVHQRQHRDRRGTHTALPEASSRVPEIRSGRRSAARSRLSPRSGSTFGAVGG